MLLIDVHLSFGFSVGEIVTMAAVRERTITRWVFIKFLRRKAFLFDKVMVGGYFFPQLIGKKLLGLVSIDLGRLETFAMFMIRKKIIFFHFRLASQFQICLGGKAILPTQDKSR